ncbi:MAG: hypothetical protein H6Q13_2230 [Bacteroidetes bacterium]|jgi:mannose/fructose/N-acetylgalactosamine-specific phosphotransferase system component IIC|nr:hypothetical protein [Bacteroidota bacterium]
MYILGFLFIIVIFIFVLGLSIVGSILRVLFGFGKRSSSTRQTTNREETEEQQKEQSKHKKLFGEDEGEYVDFEEVTDTKK